MALALPAGRRGQLLALSMTLLAAAAVWAGAIVPVLDWYGDRAELLRRQHAIARRMASLVETLPALRREASRLNRTGAAGSDPDADVPGANVPPGDVPPGDVPPGDTPAALLSGTSDPLAAASLQQRIEAFATEAGVHVGSEEILPGQPDGDLRAISVRLTMSAPYRPLVSLLLALARSETPMVVDELLMRGPPGKAGDEEAPFDSSMTVTSWRSAKADPR